MKCRIRGGNDTTTLPIGQYAEFFRLGVDTSKDPFLLFSRTGSITTKPISVTTRALRKIKRIFHVLPEARPAKQFSDFNAGLWIVPRNYSLP